MYRETTGRPMAWDIVLAVACGIVVFVALMVATGGVIVSLVTAVVTLALLGLLHYISWGQAMARDVRHERPGIDTARPGGANQAHAPTSVLSMDQRERQAIVNALEEWLSGTRTAVPATPRAIERRQAIQDVLDRLRAFSG